MWKRVDGVLKFLFAAIWVCGWMGVCVAYDVGVIRDALGRGVATTYPVAEAVVKSAKLVDENDDGTIYERVVLTYAYEVNGVGHEKTTEGPRSRPGKPNSTAKVYLAEHPVGSKLKVWYRPSDPDQSFLRVGVTGNDLLALIYVVPFHVIGIGVAVAAFPRGRRDDRSPGDESPIRGLVVIRSEDGNELRVRVPQWSPATIALARGLVYGILAYFAVAILGRNEPEVWLVLSMFGLAGLLTHDSYRRRKARIQEGLYDLTLDEAERLLTLPPTYGRSKPVVLEYARVVEIETHADDRGEDSPTTYPVVIHRRDGTGGVHKETVFESNDEARSRPLAKWLEHRVLGARSGRSRKRRSREDAARG